MSEMERGEASLQNFQMEIKKLKEVVPQLFAVENTDTLGQAEQTAWETYKQLFRKIESGLAKSDRAEQEQLEKWRAELDELTGSIMKNIEAEKDKDRVQFFAWMNNQLNYLVGNLYLVSIGNMSREEFVEMLGEKKKRLLFT